MDEVRMTGSRSASPLAQRNGDTGTSSAGFAKNLETTENKLHQAAAEQSATPAIQDHREKVENAVRQLNEYVQSIQRGIRFDFDEDVSRTVITVMDRSTNEVIRQIPDEVALELARNLAADSASSGSFSLLSVKA
jgi:flagellar protein FlaG